MLCSVVISNIVCSPAYIKEISMRFQCGVYKTLGFSTVMTSFCGVVLLRFLLVIFYYVGHCKPKKTSLFHVMIHEIKWQNRSFMQSDFALSLLLLKLELTLSLCVLWRIYQSSSHLLYTTSLGNWSLHIFIGNLVLRSIRCIDFRVLYHS